MSFRYSTAVLDGPQCLDGGKLKVLIALAEWADENGLSWHSIAEIARRARLGERATRYVLRQLEEEGYLVIEQGHGRTHTSRYILQLDALIKGAIGAIIVAPINKEEKGQNPTEKGQNDDIKGAMSFAPESPINPHIESPILTKDESNARARNEPAPIGGLRALVQQQAVSKGQVYQELYDATCGVLNRKNGLTEDQRKQVQKFYDQYGGDNRLDVALVQYARETCASRNVANFRYFAEIIANRLDNPDWISVEAEQEGMAQNKQRGRSNGHEHTAAQGIRQSNNGSAKDNRTAASLIAKMERRASRHTGHDNHEIAPGGRSNTA